MLQPQLIVRGSTASPAVAAARTNKNARAAAN
jgi:hypothetical protein